MYFPVVVTRLPESASVNPAGTCLIVISRAPRLSTVRSVKRRVTVTGIPGPSVIPWTAPVSVQEDIWEIGKFVFVFVRWVMVVTSSVRVCLDWYKNESDKNLQS